MLNSRLILAGSPGFVTYGWEVDHEDYHGDHGSCGVAIDGRNGECFAVRLSATSRPYGPAKDPPCGSVHFGSATAILSVRLFRLPVLELRV